MAEILIALKLGNSVLMFLWHLSFSLSEQMPDDLKRTAVAFTGCMWPAGLEIPGWQASYKGDSREGTLHLLH